MFKKIFMTITIALLLMQVNFSSVQAADNWLQISGRAFSYQGSIIYLRGENFNNGPALGGNTWLTTGDITKIPETQADYQKLKAMGGNHVRFGLDYGWYSKDRTQFYSTLDQHVAWAKASGLWFLPVMFILPGNCYEGYSTPCPFWDNTTLMQQLKDFWVDFIQHYANDPTVIGIDVQNEPTVGASHNWQTNYFWDYAKTVRDAVVSARIAINPSATMLVFIEGGSDPNNFSNFGANVVYEEHMYMPSGITHGATSGSPKVCTTNAVYPGASSDWGFSGSPTWSKAILSGTTNQSILTRFAGNWAKNNNVPYYVGEWGARSACPGWNQYIADVGDILNYSGINYAHFNWRANAGNFDIFPQSGSLVVQNQNTYDIMLSLWKATSPTRMLIPLYSSPPGQWATVVSANTYKNIDVIINPNNGPGGSKSTNYTNGVATLRAGGVGVLGYVYTDYGARSVSVVKAEIDNWVSWYGVDGIFFDEESNLSGDLAYFQDMYNYVHAKGLTAFGNPGTSTIESYVPVMDTTCIYENDSGQTFSPPSWVSNYPASKFCLLQYKATDAQMQATVALAKSKNIGYIYVNNDDLDNPWDAIPPYLAEEAALLANGIVSPTVTPTNTVVATNTSTPTVTKISTPTKTITPTFSPTVTVVRTVTPTYTPTQTSTLTQIPTKTPTRTPTATQIFTPTKTQTKVPTSTATPIITSTVAPTSTIAPTPTPTSSGDEITVVVANRGFAKYLNIRTSPSMYASTIGYYLPKVSVSLFEIQSNSEGDWGRTGIDQWIALYLNSNHTYYTDWRP